ncbi:prevent-host-death family protein [Duganella sp. 1411]|uniref:type II toxin-antitoxin system prevent-host-death family antitoxin n=1 Tax=Duganella sp. 1411 TaxID=2806572 RepID=UPI001AE5E387|nr:type II toxin-antitoxin system prevent-host-death family antitoxin [Duganella sp. 1411]MBP1208149.1 prevent-host-death family protein [Duganella sp. 1411]
MTTAAPLKIYNAKDAETQFGEVLNEASRKPVGITKRGRVAAYILSRRDFDAMVSRIQELEDQLWLAKADLAREGGFVGSERVKTILGAIGDVQNEEAGANS